MIQRNRPRRLRPLARPGHRHGGLRPKKWTSSSPSSHCSKLVKEAREKPTAQSAFKRFRVDVWTESLVRWLPADKAACSFAVRSAGDPVLAMLGLGDCLRGKGWVQVRD
jgi:hypothetical protein